MNNKFINAARSKPTLKLWFSRANAEKSATGWTESAHPFVPYCVALDPDRNAAYAYTLAHDAQLPSLGPRTTGSRAVRNCNPVSLIDTWGVTAAGYEYAQDRSVPPTIEGITQTVVNRQDVQGLDAYYFHGRRATPGEIAEAIQVRARSQSQVNLPAALKYD